MTYTINGSTITCHICGMTSHNPNDVENHYCGNCHIFHDDIQIMDNKIIEEDIVRIDKLIKILNSLRDQYGNLPIRVMDHTDYDRELLEIEVVDDKEFVFVLLH